MKGDDRIESSGDGFHALRLPGGWRCLKADWAADWAPDPLRLLDALDHPDRVLRDDGRSQVLLFHRLPGASGMSRDPSSDGPAAVVSPQDPPSQSMSDPNAEEPIAGESSRETQVPAQPPPGPWVVKRPRWWDRRTLNRLSTLYRRGEAEQVFRSSLKFLRIGFPLPRPVMVLERRRLGMVLESLLLYEYAQGEPVEERHWPQVVELLERLHQAGYRHRDPHLANWLQHEDRVLALDANPRRSLLRPVAAAYDFLKLLHDEPRILPLVPSSEGWAWEAARFRQAWIESWRRLKRWMRGIEE